MIDHNYKITTREVLKPWSSDTHFVSKLEHVTIVNDGKNIELDYPEIEFIGKTQIEAILQANEAIRKWIEHLQFLPTSSFEVYAEIPA